MESGAGLRLELFALDMEASIAFYTRVLGFELARHEPGGYASLRVAGAHQFCAEVRIARHVRDAHSRTHSAR